MNPCGKIIGHRRNVSVDVARLSQRCEMYWLCKKCTRKESEE